MSHFTKIRIRYAFVSGILSKFVHKHILTGNSLHQIGHYLCKSRYFTKSFCNFTIGSSKTFIRLHTFSQKCSLFLVRISILTSKELFAELSLESNITKIVTFSLSIKIRMIQSIVNPLSYQFVEFLLC